MAVFEVEPTVKTTVINGSYSTLNLQYKLPKTKTQKKEAFSVPYDPQDIMTADSAYRFATSVAMFGSILRGSKYINGIGFDDVLQLAQMSAKSADVSQKEFLDVVDKADAIYNPGKKKRR